MIVSELEAPMSLGGILRPRQTNVLRLIGVAPSSWYRKPSPNQARRRGPPRKAIPEEVVRAVVDMATANPWYGYKRIAVMCRRAGQPVKDRQAFAVMKDHGLLHKPKPRQVEAYQAAKLFELLPQRPNDLWQMDVTYVHIPGHGWWYAVTVIDYYSRYLLACHLTSSYSALEATHALKVARTEAERLCGPLTKRPFLVTDNGSSFIARRFVAFARDQYSHVRIQYRTPQQLGLLERLHQTLKSEEVYWRLYDDPQHCRVCLAEFRVRYNERRPHWALIPEEGGDPLVRAEVYPQQRRIQLPRWQTWARAAQQKLEEMFVA
ncbi:MAG TPA: DDE-type integrase/transposase/recombinase [Pirellulales bacterium]|nr:DDE-type integrase/transposase/recombinase [Pirellulales bacterium]